MCIRDRHRLVPKRKLYLGGLKIKSKFGTLGHSDGDPVLHAITDAILGACKMGDIGQKFSDKNKKFKGIRSTIFLKKVINEIKENLSKQNIDDEIDGVETTERVLKSVKFYLPLNLHHVHECLCRCDVARCVVLSN